jgi:ketosteroid isomerase-like protein
MKSEKATAASIEAVINAEQQLAAAHAALDLHQLEQLLHPDYLIIQPGGRTEDKEDVLASYRSGNRHWETARSDQLDVRLYGSTAVVIGRWTAAGQNGDEPFAYSARFLAVWVYADGLWQNVASQSTTLSQDQP